jgi:hypothetical protein
MCSATFVDRCTRCTTAYTLTEWGWLTHAYSSANAVDVNDSLITRSFKATVFSVDSCTCSVCPLCLVYSTQLFGKGACLYP